MPNDRVLIDTSAWIFALRKAFLPEIKDRVDLLLKEDRVLTTGIVKLELLSGTRTENEYHRLKNRLSSLGNIETDTSLWNTACNLGFRLRRGGITIPHTDILISACALSAGCTLLHADRHFDLAASHLELKTESYADIARTMQ